MMDAGIIITGIISGGVGASIGSIGTAMVTARAGKGEARAHAADLIAEAAGGLATTQAATIGRLDRENRHMRLAIGLLTEVLDELLPQLNLEPESLRRLRQANSAAKAVT